ncbi:helix-turn-helix transcriptional regulator [Streptomyces sp. NPDC050617]|uniref:helix-turn-helix domain-containing protein n=1 Tax=Streptomyces sp. NPDC050617 TaxID=3154628 RepID=UPI003417E388
MQEVDDATGRTPRERFGDAVKAHRKAWPGQMTQTQLARKARMSKSAISRIERAVPPIPNGLPALLDEIFQTDGLFKRLHDEVTAESFPVVYRHRMALERQAITILEWSPTVVPGMFQTASYARALFRGGDRRASEDEISAAVAARLTRQDRLRSVAPPDVRVVLCESVLMRIIGSREVMRDQLAALLTHSQQLTTRLQILPLDAPSHLLVDWPVSFLTTPKHVTLMCVENYRTAGVLEEPERVRAAMSAYDDLTGDALSPGESATLLRDHMESL